MGKSFVKSRQGTSSSESSNKYQPQIEQEILGERNKLLNSKIFGINIGIEPLSNPSIHAISDCIPLRILKGGLPSHLGGSTFLHHLSCLLELEDCYVILEYGGYFGTEKKFKNYVHYWNEDGLRFSIMDGEDYEYEIFKKKYGAKLIYNPELIMGNNMTLLELITKCCSKMRTRAKDYDALTNNCQDFIAKVIEVLNLKRRRCYEHNYSLKSIPPVIVKAFEENEDMKALIFFEKIPILGLIIEDIAQTVYLIKNK
jgi:hypothetical protein